MSTWTLEQIAQARGLRAEAQVDPVVIERGRVDVLRETKAKLARRLREFAHPFVIEINEADLRFSETPGDEAWEPITIRCWWQPPTDEVELVGGQCDGMRLSVQRVGDPIEVARPLREVEFFETAANEPITLDRDTYVLTGWREEERVWVYQAR